MNTKHLKTLIVTMTERIQELERELRIKEFTINNFQMKLKEYEGREE